jgi:hypothetical protein
METLLYLSIAQVIIVLALVIFFVQGGLKPKPSSGSFPKIIPGFMNPPANPKVGLRENLQGRVEHHQIFRLLWLFTPNKKCDHTCINSEQVNRQT